MTIHEFVAPAEKPAPERAPDWVGYTCKHCGRVSGLNAAQIKAMPLNMAKCDKSPKRASFFEWMLRRVNCLGAA